ncbi:unnamed protein product [Vitrella brassicaformis CCMP3155]|uniref:Cytochrome b5 heme-binding domain-containing protein n=1 Tax=Vitrella brassicaformis (strain CCMP3155) TaxID=1169540 RepID=A0A0G4G8Q1_VITBC|nr:unnamed protein product [Vitrella brassicaformis CCMP3155]|eukprot:CEM24762.1 unnamed protein product [Vitrella brassicaformis CCMP3155]
MGAKRGSFTLPGNHLSINGFLLGVGLLAWALISDGGWTRVATLLVLGLSAAYLLFRLVGLPSPRHLTRLWRFSNGDCLTVRKDHEMAVARKAPKYVTPAAFRQAVQDGKKWTIINGSVYDLAGLIEDGKHPGGDFLADFVGIDSSLTFYTAHVKQESVWRRLRVSWMGYLVPDVGEDTSDLMCSRDKAMHSLIDEFAAEDLFAYPLRFWLWDMSGPLLVLCSFLAAHWCIQGRVAPSSLNWPVYVASILAGSLGYLLVQYLCHDAGHQSVFVTKERARRFCKWFAVISGGVDWSEGAVVHDVHHAFPHVLGRDKSLDTTPLIYWHPAQLVDASLDTLSRARGFAAATAGCLWFCVILWLYCPLEVARSLVEAARRKGGALCFGTIVLRLLAPFGLMVHFGASVHYALWPMMVQEVGFVLLALCASLNHFAFDAITVQEFQAVTHQTAAPEHAIQMQGFVAHQAGITQNHNIVALEHGLHGLGGLGAGAEGKAPSGILMLALVGSYDAVLSFWTGHFNYHIEHHLMPYMPRRNLPKAAARCRALCGEQLYASASHAEGLAMFVNKLSRPF